MTFPRAQEPESHDDFLNLLPPGLRAFIDRELAAGNAIAQTGTGFPAAPIGVWIVLSKPYLTLHDPLPPDTVHRRRPQWTWPAECTDTPRHFFVLSGPEPEPPPPPKQSPPCDNSPTYNSPTYTPNRPPVSAPATPFGYADMFDREALDKRVSAAIAEHLGLMFDQDAQNAIRAQTGDEGLTRVKEIDDFANNPEFWQNARSHDRAYQQIQRDLATKYPFLTPAAIQRLATRAAWSWR